MPIKQFLLVFGVAVGLLSQTPASKAAWTQIQLPQTMEMKQEIENCPEAWEVHDSLNDNLPARYKRSAHTLENVGVYDGHPRMMVSLQEDSEKIDKAKKLGVYYYNLAPVSKDGTWIKCTYYSTRLSLCQRVPREATEIRITMELLSKNSAVVRKVEYR